MDKLLWAVQAGDQIGDSEDDQPCGDHFIDKDLECHEGDAHRPTPGKNPYWQGDRQGPEDKSKTPEKSGKNQPGHERDRDQHTQQNKQRMERLLDNGHTPESLGRDQVNHFADMMEDAYQRPLNDKDIHTLVDMVNQKMGESFSQDPSQKGIHDPTAPQGFKGPKGREMSRPDSYHKETTDDAYTPGPGGGPEAGGLYDHYKNILKDRTGDGGESAPEPKKEGGPSQEMKDEQDKWEGPGYQGEDAPESKPEKGEPGDYEFQDRQVDEWDPSQGPEESKPYRQKERRRQTKKDYKRKKDAKKKEGRASLAPQLTWGKIVQDRVDDDEEQRRDRGVVNFEDSEEESETTASKPKFGKSTEHSGAKKGKGAYDKKKTAKQTSNKGRRAMDKKASQDTTVGDESDGPFPGAAPLFKKAAAMNWTTAEPRPCYPEEEPVEDHCNDSIAPPAPGGGDDMGTTPPKGFSEQEQGPVDWDSYEGFDPQEEQDTGDDFLELGDDPMENAGPVEEQKYSHDWGSDPANPGPFSDDPSSPDYRDPYFDSDEHKDNMQREYDEAGPQQDAPDTSFDDLLSKSPDGMGPQGRTPSPDGMGPQGHDGEPSPGGPHGARAPGLAPDAPHQFWSQEAPHVQDALKKYVVPQMNSTKPGVADKARRIFFEGPRVDFDQKDPESALPAKGTGMRRVLDGPQGDPSLYPDEE